MSVSLANRKELIYNVYRDGTEKVSSNHIKNKSDVEGATVSDALNYLLDNAGGGAGSDYLPVGAGSAGQHLRTDGTNASWSNNINLAPGTLGSPGLVFVGDLDTGMFSPSSGTFGFVCDGITQTTISSTGIISTNYLVAPKLKINNGIALGNTLISDATGEFFSTPLATALVSQNTFGSNVLIGDHCGTRGSGFDYVVAIGQNAFGGFGGMPTSLANGSVAIGQGSLYAITSGVRNCAIGFNSMAGTTDGGDNTACGYNALTANFPSTSSNSAFGSNTLIAVQSSGCSAFGANALQVCTTGINTAFGKDAGKTLTTGTGNTILGYLAFDASGNSVNYCTAIGDSALSGVLTTGANGATAVGYQALTALTSGAQNIAIGYQNQKTITTGASNTTLGYNVMSNASVAVATSNIVGIGASALAGALTAGANSTVAVGNLALTALTSGSSNVAVGYQGQKTITTGASNTTLGYNVMSHASVAVATSSIVGIGASALAGALTTATNGTVAIGDRALTALTSGGGNLAIGSQSLRMIATGGNNTAVGHLCMSSGSMASNVDSCTAFGTGALNGALTNGANYTTAIGMQALNALTSGSFNTAVGYNGQKMITTGTSNTTLGYMVMGNASTAVATSFCVGIGASALAGALTASANGTVAIGNSALTALTSGGSCTAVGYNAGYTLTTGSNCTLFGFNANVDSPTASGRIVIGKDALGTVDNGLFVPTTLASVSAPTSPLCFNSATGQIGTAPIAYTSVLTTDQVIAVNNTVVDTNMTVSVPAGTYAFRFMGGITHSTATGGAITIKCSTATTLSFTGMSQISGSSTIVFLNNSQSVLAGNTGDIINDSGSTSQQIEQATGTLTCASACVFTVAGYSSANQNITFAKGSSFSLKRTS